MTDFKALLGSAVDGLQQEFYAAGETIFEAGGPGNRMFVILAGEISIEVEGRRIDRLQAGTIVGEMALIDDGARSASAVALQDCRLLPVDRALFGRLIQQVPNFAIQVMATMSERTRRLVDKRVALQRLEEELRIARQIQLSLLPGECPVAEGWQFAADYRAAREVGGDLYDFIQVPEEPGKLYFVIADVTGKGVPAAIYMASSRNTMRSEAMSQRGPAEAMTHANRVFSADKVARLFLSAIYAVLEVNTGRLSFALAGHERPLWLQAASGLVSPLEARGMLLGAFPGLAYEEQAITIAPGDSVVFFTDGVTEARNAQGELFGDERLQVVLASSAGASADQLLQAISLQVADFAGETPPSDDLTLVIFRRLPKS
jgi:serine phosphatase RsbU (regulator of sigma subunit)